MECASLPLPQLERTILGTIPMLTDNALARTLGVRVAFTGREGGVSAGAYGALNLGDHVGDNPTSVAENRRRIAKALGADPALLVAANQVHGTTLVEVADAAPAAMAAARAEAALGADGLVVRAPQVLGLLCFADCTPIAAVAPTGAFGLAHGGWRGTVGHIARATVERLAAAEGVDPAQINVYIGPHIKACCFEVGSEVAQRFADEFGAGCVVGDNHVSLAAAVTADVLAAGVDPQRVVEAGVCTRCHPDEYFSYRATDGHCGRHGVLAFKGAN